MGLFSRFKKPLAGADANSSPAEPTDGVPGASDASAQATPASDLAAGDGADAMLITLKMKIAELSNGQMNPELIDPAASFFDYGYLDSLSAVTLISFVEEKYGVSVTELDLVGSLGNIQALVEHIERSQRA